MEEGQALKAYSGDCFDLKSYGDFKLPSQVIKWRSESYLRFYLDVAASEPA